MLYKTFQHIEIAECQSRAESLDTALLMKTTFCQAPSYQHDSWGESKLSTDPVKHWWPQTQSKSHLPSHCHPGANTWACFKSRERLWYKVNHTFKHKCFLCPLLVQCSECLGRQTRLDLCFQSCTSCSPNLLRIFTKKKIVMECLPKGLDYLFKPP